jgi:hypothetical protein
VSEAWYFLLDSFWGLSVLFGFIPMACCVMLIGNGAVLRLLYCCPLTSFLIRSLVAFLSVTNDYGIVKLPVKNNFAFHICNVRASLFEKNINVLKACFFSLIFNERRFNPSHGNH